MIIKKGQEYLKIPKPRNLYGIRCINCNRMATDVHHCLTGKDRKKCDEDGLTVGLCRECHNQVHNDPAKDDLYNELKRIAQRVYEREHSREEFMKRYYKNYLWEE